MLESERESIEKEREEPTVTILYAISGRNWNLWTIMSVMYIVTKHPTPPLSIYLKVFGGHIGIF